MHKVKILEIYSLTHNVKRFTVEKPKDYVFTPGQATEVAINKEGWEDKKRPFTFTSLPQEEHLEFTIKTYHDHKGVTNELDGLLSGDELLIDNAWGAIHYNGPGIFIAGGAGITPFIAIFRMLEKENKLEGNKLIFSNKKQQDVILESYFAELLGDNFISTLTHEKVDDHLNEKIGMEFLKKHVESYSQNFYICGPDQMVKDLSSYLETLGAKPDGITFEK